MSQSEIVYISPTEYEEARIGAVAIYCSDGRIGEQMDDFLHNGLNLPRYDRLTCPGGPVCMSGRMTAHIDALGVEDQLRFLIRVHGLQQVVLIAHEGCAYYRTRLRMEPEEQQRAQLFDLNMAAQRIQLMNDTLRVSTFMAKLIDKRLGFAKVGLHAARQDAPPSGSPQRGRSI